MQFQELNFFKTATKFMVDVHFIPLTRHADLRLIPYEQKRLHL
jgi:hypothetical protein